MATESRERGGQRKRKAVDEPHGPSNYDTESPSAKKVKPQSENQPPGLKDGSSNGHETQKEPQEKPGDDSHQLPKQYNENYLIRKALQRASMQRPKLYLTKKGIRMDCVPQDVTDAGETKKTETSLATVDLQHLFVHAVLGRKFPPPRWCCLLRPGKVANVVLIVLKDVSYKDFEQNQDCFPFLDKTFRNFHRVKFVSPSAYYSSFDLDMYAVPQSFKQVEKFFKLNGYQFERHGQQVMFPVKIQGTKSKEDSTGEKTTTGDETTGDKDGASAVCRPAGYPSCGINQLTAGGVCWNGTQPCTRRHLLLSASQMIAEKYPMPDGDSTSKEDGFVFSKSRYEPVTDQSPLFAVDCEMVLTTAQVNELARVSIVNENNEVIYDELVKPRNPVINHLTKHSGITPRMLVPVTKRIDDVQQEISNLLPPDAILCGQSLCFDLKALKLYHPYVIDTSVIYNLSGNRKIKCGLRRLALHFLGRVIQSSSDGHCSAEDATATMDLIKIKLTQSLNYGDSVLGGINFPCIPAFLGNERQSYSSAGNFTSASIPHASFMLPRRFLPSSPMPFPSTPPAPTALLPFPSAPPRSQTSGPSLTSVPPASLPLPPSATFSSPLVGHPPATSASLTPAVPSAGTPLLPTPSLPTLTQNSVKQKQDQPMTEMYQVNAEASEVLQKSPKVDLSKVHRIPQVTNTQEGVQSTVLMRSLFDLIMDGNMQISASLIGRQDLVAKYEDEKGLICLKEDNDKKVCKKARSICQMSKFSWVEFSAFSDLLQSQELVEEGRDTSEKEKKGVLKKLNKYVKKVVRKIPPKSLVTVVMPGRRNGGDDHLTAAAFCNIT